MKSVTSINELTLRTKLAKSSSTMKSQKIFADELLFSCEETRLILIISPKDTTFSVILCTINGSIHRPDDRFGLCLASPTHLVVFLPCAAFSTAARSASKRLISGKRSSMV